MNGGHFWWLHNLYIPRVVASAIFSVGYFTPGAILPLDFFLCISVLFRAGESDVSPRRYYWSKSTTVQSEPYYPVGISSALFNFNNRPQQKSIDILKPSNNQATTSSASPHAAISRDRLDSASALARGTDTSTAARTRSITDKRVHTYIKNPRCAQANCGRACDP